MVRINHKMGMGRDGMWSGRLANARRRAGAAATETSGYLFYIFRAATRCGLNSCTHVFIFGYIHLLELAVLGVARLIVSPYSLENEVY